VAESLIQSPASSRSLPARVSCACPLRRIHRAISSYRQTLWILGTALLSAIGAAPGVAQDVSKEQMRSLDEQVQEIKSDVLGIAAELGLLEERLLFPSNTQVAVFVSLAEREEFRLDSVRIQIDGQPVAHHIYSFKELAALQKGGVQRIYTGNVSTGEHQLEVSYTGKRAGGGDVAETESFSFRKNVEPKIVQITLAEWDSGGAGIQLGGP
jgi:hypothetical protein